MLASKEPGGPASRPAHCCLGLRPGLGGAGSGPGGVVVMLQGDGPRIWSPNPGARPPAPGGGDGFVARVGSTAGGAEAGLRGGVHHSQPSALQRAPRMASPARAAFPARKNSRLDAFLRRRLPARDLQRHPRLRAVHRGVRHGETHLKVRAAQ